MVKLVFIAFVTVSFVLFTLNLTFWSKYMLLLVVWIIYLWVYLSTVELRCLGMCTWLVVGDRQQPWDLDNILFIYRQYDVFLHVCYYCQPWFWAKW